MKTIKLRYLALLACGLGATASQALILGTSIGPTTGGLRMDGLGVGAFGLNDPSSGLGLLVYTVGACTNTSLTLTTCSLTGNYQDDLGSDGTSGGGGAFSLVVTYDPTQFPPIGSLMPLIAEIGSAVPSTDPNNPYNQASLIARDSLLQATLTLNTLGGDTIVRRSYYSDPADPTSFVSEFAWNTQFFDGNQTGAPVCTGLAADVACSVGNVSLVDGATISGAVRTFSFATDSRTSVPEPGTLGLLGLALAGFAATRKRSVR